MRVRFGRPMKRAGTMGWNESTAKHPTTTAMEAAAAGDLPATTAATMRATTAATMTAATAALRKRRDRAQAQRHYEEC